jgi:hypothetical protein
MEAGFESRRFEGYHAGGMLRTAGAVAAIITLAIGCAVGCSARAIHDDAATVGARGALGTDAMNAAGTAARVNADMPIDAPADASVPAASDAAAAVGDDAADDGPADVPVGQAPSPDGGWQEGPGFASTGTVISVWATSSTDVWAASNLQTSGDGGITETSSLQHWNGTTWTQFAGPPVTGPPGVSFFQRIWASGANDLWAATAQGLWRWNGTWTDVTPSPTQGNYMYFVWGVGPNDVWALKGAGAPGVHHWNGAQWTGPPFGGIRLMPNGSTNGHVAGSFSPAVIWGVSSDDVWFGGAIIYESLVGESPLDGSDIVGYAHWDGAALTEYRPATVADVRSGSIWGMWGSSASNVFAVGTPFGGRPAVVEHFDGVDWSRVPITAPGDLFGIWGSSATDIWAGGNSGGPDESVPLLLHFDGISWSTQPTSFAPTDPGQTLNSISGTGVDDFWIGSGRGVYTAPLVIGSVYHRHP